MQQELDRTAGAGDGRADHRANRPAAAVECRVHEKRIPFTCCVCIIMIITDVPILVKEETRYGSCSGYVIPRPEHSGSTE